jgi:hypothetical protein
MFPGSVCIRITFDDVSAAERAAGAASPYSISTVLVWGTACRTGSW